MKALKKAWIFLLRVCLAALFSTTALAANTTSGTCGDNLTWVLDSGTLTISGTGEMAEYSSSHSVPWYTSRESITTVIIEGGVTSICKWAFSGCSSLTSATMPDSITTIGDSAFYECRGLSSITIPDGVTSIGSLTFYRCTSLTSVTIPAIVTFIGDDDYDDQSIVNRYPAFTGCRGLTEFVVSEGSATYCAVDGVLFSKDKTILLCYPAGKADNSYVVPNGVTFIGCCAFSESTNLTSVTIPDGVTYIGNDALSSCSSLTSMKIPSGVTESGSGAFSACRSLSSITIPSSVTYIGDSAFRNCTSLTDVYYSGSENNWNVVRGTYIGSYGNDCLFSATIHYNSTGPDSTSDTGDTDDTDNADDTDTMSGTCGENATWTLKNGVLTISGTGDMEDYGTPWSTLWESITDVVIEDGITSIGIDAFRGCSNLTNLSIPNSITSIDDDVFNGCSSLASVTIPDSVTSISDAAFAWCGSLASATIGSGVTSIDDCTFQGCSNLTSISIPYGVITVGDWSFYGCDSLTDVYYSSSENDWNAIEIGEYNDPLTSATIHYNSTGAGDETDESTPGDLNGDGEVNASDLTVLARHVGKVEYITDETALANADVTGDGEVDASDLTKLAQYVGKIISSLD